MADKAISNLFKTVEVVCAVDGCGKSASTREWCKPHYDAWRRTGDPATYKGDQSHLSDWEKVLLIGFTRTLRGCLEYNGYRNELGYGQFRPRRGPLIRVHRLAYENLVGPLASKMEVLHLCDNPSCSEPTHLRAGTHLENMRDMRSKKRGFKDNWTHCPNGHLYPPERPPALTKNRCRECCRERSRTYHRRKKEHAHAMACSEVVAPT